MRKAPRFAHSFRVCLPILLLFSTASYAQWRQLRPADCLSFDTEVSLKGEIFRRLYPMIKALQGTISDAREVHSLLLLDEPICIVEPSSNGRVPKISIFSVIDLNTETSGPDPRAKTLYDINGRHAVVRGLLSRPQENLGPGPFVEVYSYVLR
jgi:hypothetical protein